MSVPFVPLRALPADAPWKKGDVLVVFGELFARGYANGLVDEAAKAGMTIVRSTVGRRASDDSLRPLNADEAALQQKPFINVPLEAGFDMQPAASGRSPVDQLQGVKMNDWQNAKLDWAEIEDSRRRGVERFKNAVDQYMRELAPLIPDGANVLFAHTMAGGVPRAKAIMPAMNRVFKGSGDRHVPSERFWDSDMGKLAAMNFDEVTANTFQTLVDASSAIREGAQAKGGRVSYVAYGYHGTEVLADGKYEWQTYSPYVQGWAKMKLEDFARQASARGIKACVFNCPEILTNSSGIFQGVEVSLYPLLGALKKDGAASPKIRGLLERCAGLLKDGTTLDDVQKETDAYLASPLMREFNAFEVWPKHSRKDEMETMLDSSNRLIALHRDERQLITFVLSEEVFKATGYIMFREAWEPRAPVLWLGHDCLVKSLATGRID